MARRERRRAGAAGQLLPEQLCPGGEHGVRIIAFLAISTGVYGYPIDDAARIVVEETRRFLSGGRGLEKIVFACFNRRNYEAYQRALNGY